MGINSTTPGTINSTMISAEQNLLAGIGHLGQGVAGQEARNTRPNVAITVTTVELIAQRGMCTLCGVQPPDAVERPPPVLRIGPELHRIGLDVGQGLER